LEAITRSFIGFVPKAVVAPWKELLRLKVQAAAKSTSWPPILPLQTPALNRQPRSQIHCTKNITDNAANFIHRSVPPASKPIAHEKGHRSDVNHPDGQALTAKRTTKRPKRSIYVCRFSRYYFNNLSQPHLL
jgi:hypothetical protein